MIESEDKKIIHTPGHVPNHYSLFVTIEKEKFLLAGDLFWWKIDEKQETNYESLLNHKDSFAEDKEKLIKSRKKVLKIADWIIPGHGKTFRNPNNKESYER